MRTRHSSRHTVDLSSVAPARLRWQGVLWGNFAVSVWTLIGYCIARSLHNVTDAAALDAAYGPFSVRAALTPLAIASVEGLLWFRPFRDRQHGARVMATFMGIVVSVLVFILLVTASVYDRDLDSLKVAVGVYVALSHLAFGILGRGPGA